jgi:hypothetical protein
MIREKGSSASMAEADSIRKSVDNHKAVTGWNLKMRGVKRKVSVEQFSEETSLKFRRLEKGKKVMGTRKTMELSVGNFAGLNGTFSDMSASQTPAMCVSQ